MLVVETMFGDTARLIRHFLLLRKPVIWLEPISGNNTVRCCRLEHLDQGSGQGGCPALYLDKIGSGNQRTDHVPPYLCHAVRAAATY
jgi:hypothetical protein